MLLLMTDVSAGFDMRNLSDLSKRCAAAHSSLHLLCCCIWLEVLASLLLSSACGATLAVAAMILLKETGQASLQFHNVLLLIVCAQWRPGWQAVYIGLIAPSLHQQQPLRMCMCSSIDGKELKKGEQAQRGGFKLLQILCTQQMRTRDVAAMIWQSICLSS